MMEKLLAPLRWFSKILSKIATVVVLTLVYIAGVSPIALLGKIVRKDFIGLRRAENAETYWVKYREKEPTLQNFQKPY